jgi:hypothetical protein
MSIPSGWTDDMNIVLPEHATLEGVVDLVISMEKEGATLDQIEMRLIESVGLSENDAALAVDRVQGGALRASTHRSNCPDRSKDPLAWISFQRAIKDPARNSSLPRYTPPKITSPWWKFW